MIKTRKAEIDLIVEDVFEKYQITKTPYKFLNKICKKENIHLLPVNFSESVDGFIQNINGEMYIFYNSNKMQERQNFTIAHELGHHFLKHISFGEALTDSEDEFVSNKNEIEIEANYFASHFLLPKELIEKDFMNTITYSNGLKNSRIPLKIMSYGVSYKKWKIITSKLCKKYKISEQMLFYKLQELNLIDSDLY